MCIRDRRKGYKFREYDNEYAANVFKNCMEAGIQAVLFIIVGYPTETKEDFQSTMDFLEENKQWIDAVYCMSTFILSKEMMSDEGKGKMSKFAIRSAIGGGGDIDMKLLEEKPSYLAGDGIHPHAVEWESETSTYEERLERLEIFKEWAEKNDKISTSPRVDDWVNPNDGTTMD